MAGDGIWYAVAGGIVLGAGYLYLKRKQAAATPTPSLGDDACAIACKASGPYCVDGGASCRATNDILGHLNPFTDSADEATGQVSASEAANNKLNGAVDVPMAGVMKANPLGPITGNVLRYKNGCTPFFDGAGWSKCAKGTLDMYGSAIDARNGVSPGAWDMGRTEESLITEAAYITVAARNAAAGKTERIDKNALMTGGPGDPTTLGPWQKDDNTLSWLVRGKPVTTPVGQAPKCIVWQAFNVKLATIAALSDAEAAAPTDIYADPNDVHTVYTSTCGKVLPGFTWVGPNPGGYWTRTAPGKSDVAAPCPTSQSQTATFVANFGMLGL